MTSSQAARRANALNPRRVHAAVFESQHTAARTSLLIAGTLADVQANTPKGGCWRHVPPGVHRAADVPPLGDLPTSLISVKIGVKTDV